MHQDKDVSTTRNKAAGNALLNLSGGPRVAVIGTILIVLLVVWGYFLSGEKQSDLQAPVLQNEQPNKSR